MKPRLPPVLGRMRCFVLAMLALLIVLAGADRAAAQSVKIVTFGDSGPAGNGVSSSQAYPAVLEATLRAKGIDARVQNISVSGDTTAMGLARVGSVPPDAQVVITEFGSNDFFANIPAAVMQSNMEAIIKRLRANGAQVLALGTRGISYSGVAGRNGAVAITYPNTFRKYLQSNGRHLTPEGHQAAVAMMLPQVMAMIGKSKKKG